ncbi:MAG: hypothetical protein WA951_06375 [Leeuwenhoekiella sp.]
MFMILIVNKYVLAEKFAGFAFWPFVIVRHKSLKTNSIFINHERIHLRQQAELFLVLFYLWYGIEFLIRWVQYGNAYLGYRNISFEREAYHHEKSMSYLKNRRVWSFYRYL